MTASTSHPGSSTAEREIVISRVFDAPRELVWAAWTDPRQVSQWWGPRGFTTTFEEREVRPGGVWKHVMHGPDGTDYPGRSVFTEVMRPERIVLTHSGGRKGSPGVTFQATWTFEAVGVGKTKLTIRMVFESAKVRDTVARDYGALEGGEQTLDRLAAILAEPREFVFTRIFTAPRRLVWETWTDRDHLMRWFGPKGVTISQCSMDLRPGGIFHYCMKTPDGHEMWGKWTFREIVAPEKLVVIHSFSDVQGGVTRHPLSATWPLETLSIATFTEHEGKTTLTLRWLPHDATAAEWQTFDSSHAGMTQGWGGTMDQLDAYLATVGRES